MTCAVAVSIKNLRYYYGLAKGQTEKDAAAATVGWRPCHLFSILLLGMREEGERGRGEREREIGREREIDMAVIGGAGVETNIQTHTHRHTHTQTHTQTHTHTHTDTHTDTHTQTHRHRHTHTTRHTQTHKHSKDLNQNF